MTEDPARWGQPASALLGALEAQLGMGLPAIGGKDSMSGTFETLDVPPTLVSFAVAMTKASKTRSAAFTKGRFEGLPAAPAAEQRDASAGLGGRQDLLPHGPFPHGERRNRRRVRGEGGRRSRGRGAHVASATTSALRLRISTRKRSMRRSPAPSSSSW